jgi:hypothetical protein
MRLVYTPHSTFAEQSGWQQQKAVKNMKTVFVSIVIALVLIPFALPIFAADHILITEVCVDPSDGEFVEIFNPTPSAIDLGNYYLTDAIFSNGDYYNIVDGTAERGGDFYDWNARFPEGLVIESGATVVVSIQTAEEFLSIYGFYPDVEVTASPNSVPNMREAFSGSIAGFGLNSLTGSGEVIILYFWDQASDNVKDVDYVLWGDGAEAVDKTGIATDGPDADEVPTAFEPDIEGGRQDVVSPAGHASGSSFQRVSMEEGDEVKTGGNGITGNNETSENLSETWITDTVTPGVNAYGPPQVVSAESINPTAVKLVYSKKVTAESAENTANYDISGDGLQIYSATLTEDSTEVTLETSAQSPLREYVLIIGNIEDTGDPPNIILEGTQVSFLGFNTLKPVELELSAGVFYPNILEDLEVTYTAEQGRRVLIRVFDMQGREAARLLEGQSRGRASFTWDGRDDLREFLEPGAYICHIEVMDDGRSDAVPLVVGTRLGD